MKTMIITGVTSGIGKSIAKSFEDSGWRVAGLSHKDADLSNLDEVIKLAEKLTKSYKSIDAIIHVAGVWHDKNVVYADKDLEDFSTQQIVDTMNVGVTSFMILCAKILPNIVKNGAVIGISGTFEDGATGWLPYYTSKRALEDFLVGLSQDYPHGPRVFGISPADTSSVAYKKFYPEYATEAQPPEVVADLCIKLAEGKAPYKPGDIVEIRDSKASKGFHK